MARIAKRPFFIILACIAAMGVAAPPVMGAERIALLEIAAERPVADRVLTLALEQGTVAPQFSFHKGAFEMARYLAAASGERRDRKALRIDLFRLRVTHPVAGDRSAGPPGTFLPSVVHIRVKQGATPDSKAVGVEMPVAPNVVVESRFGPGGQSDTGVRFKIRY